MSDVYTDNSKVIENLQKELEKENAELRNNGFTVSAMTEQQLKVAIEKGKQLESENAELKQQIEKMKCCSNCKSFKGYGETCEGWGEPVLDLNCDCTEWELKE